MRTAVRPVASFLVPAAVLLVAVPHAVAAPKRIRGELSKPGYTVIALAGNGDASAVRATGGKFKLRPPAKRVTLHLRAPDGTYAGPVVVGRDGKRAIVGVRAGAKLGDVRISARKGYAKVSQRLPAQSLNSGRTAKAKKGIPIGAGVFGRVGSKPPRNPIRGDYDLDGVEDPIDIDDDGDKILDDVDRSPAVSAAQVANPSAPQLAGFTSALYVGLEGTANANAPGSSDEQIEAAVAAFGRLQFHSTMASDAELDCGGSENPSPPPPWLGGLEYCTRGGTGTVPADPPEFPECCDLDGDGFGTIPSSVGFDAPNILLPGTSEISTGNEVLVRFPDRDPIPILLPYVFATAPALVSYHDSAGNSGTAEYPYPAGIAPPDFPVAAGADGQVRVTLTLWPPQRRPIGTGDGREACLDDTPPCRWIDMGGLTYGVALEGAGGPCGQSAYSEDDPTTAQVEDDPDLVVPTDAVTGEGMGFRDARQPPDRPASPTDTLTFTVNLTACENSPWTSGQTRRIRLNATPPQDPTLGTSGKALQLVQFRHE